MSESKQQAEIANLLADEFVGVEEPEKEPVVVEDEAEADVALPDGDGEDTQLSSVDDDDKSAATDSDTPETDEEAVYTLNEMAADYDKKVEDLYHVSVKLGDGEAMTIGELKDFRDSNKDIDQLRVGFVEKEQEIEQRLEDLTQQSQDINNTPGITNEFLQARANVLAISQSYDRVNWEELRTHQPGEWAAMQQDFQNQFTQAKAAEAEAQTKVDMHTEKNSKFQQDRLFAAIPELKDETFRAQTSQSLVEFASKYGISSKEVGDITDSRVMHMMIDSSRKATAQAQAKEKIVKQELPKSVKPSPAKPSQSANGERKAAVKRLMDTAKSSGKVKDQDIAISALLNESS